MSRIGGHNYTSKLSSNCVTLCCLDRCETSQLRQSYVTRHMSTAPQIPYMGLHRKTTASLPEIGPFVGGAMDAQVRFIVPRGGVGISANDDLVKSGTATLFVLFPTATGTELVSTRFGCLQPDCLPA